jgi:hypothetical protein
MDYRDFGLYELTLSAVSTGDLVEGYFDYLRFNRSISGEAFFRQQADMGAALAARYRSVVQQQGLEVSLALPLAEPPFLRHAALAASARSCRARAEPSAVPAASNLGSCSPRITAWMCRISGVKDCR